MTMTRRATLPLLAWPVSLFLLLGAAECAQYHSSILRGIWTSSKAGPDNGDQRPRSQAALGLNPASATPRSYAKSAQVDSAPGSTGAASGVNKNTALAARGIEFKALGGSSAAEGGEDWTGKTVHLVFSNHLVGGVGATLAFVRLACSVCITLVSAPLL